MRAPAVEVVMADDDRNDQLLTALAADQAEVDAEFTFVDDGAQLLRLLTERVERDDLPDLILLDLRMPMLSGHETLRQLQAHQILWQIPVVVFSSSSRREDEQRSFEEGATWFETKPSNFADMVDFIASLPERSQHRPYELTSVDITFDRAAERATIDLRALES